MWAPVSLCLVPVKFEQQPASWCQGLSGVRAGIIEQRAADRGSWHWDQTDVAIIKKYTTSELNIKSPGSERGGRCELLLCLFFPVAELFKSDQMLRPCQTTKPGESLQLRRVWKWILETFKEASCKKTSVRAILQIHYSGWSRDAACLCQSVLKHLRHSSPVMKSVGKRGLWQSAFRTLFY